MDDATPDISQKATKANSFSEFVNHLEHTSTLTMIKLDKRFTEK